MALPELTQAQRVIEQASRVMLVVPAKASHDALASMMALYLALHATKAEDVDEVSPSHVPTPLQFLPGSSQVHMQPQSQAEITLDIAGPETIVATRQVPLQGGMRLYVTLPEGATVTKDSLETTVRALPYDAVVLLGAADLEALGELFHSHADFFYNTPIINIDHKPDNEHFGTINLVDITAGSVAEVVYELLTTMFSPELDRDVATALYAGVIAGTDSFQRPTTTPQSFQVAARLMELEADREAVIQHLVKTKPLSLLKLSGRLYARLRFDEHQGLFWSIVRPHDFSESGAKEDDLSRAMYELSDNIAGFTACFVLHEHTDGSYQFHLMLGKGMQKRRSEIQEQLSATRDNGLFTVKITAPSLEAAEATALEQVRSVLP